MKRELKYKRGETLNEYVVRIANHYGGKKVDSEELAEVLHELSVQSYIHGSRDAIGAIRR